MLGNYHTSISNPIKSRDNYIKSLKIFQTYLSEDLQSATTKLLLAQTYSVLDDIDNSVRYYNQAIEQFENKKYERFLSLAYVNYTNFLIQTGEHSNLLNNWRKVIETVNDLQGTELTRALLRYGFAEYERQYGNHSKAYSLYDTVIEYFAEKQYHHGVAYSKLGQAEALIKAKKFKESSQLIMEATEIFKKQMIVMALLLPKW